MVTIPVQISEELAQRLQAYQDRLSEIIEIGLHQIENETGNEEPIQYSEEELAKIAAEKRKILSALASTGIVTLPNRVESNKHERWEAIQAGGPPASEMIIAERNRKL